MESKKVYKLLDTSFFLAWKSIVKNKKITVLILLIIGLGFISSVTVTGLLKDIGYKIEGDFIDTLVGHIILEPIKKGEKIEDVRSIVKKLETLPNIEGIAAVQKKSAKLIDSNGGYITGEIWIVSPGEIEGTFLLDDLLKEGDFLNEKNLNEFYTGCANIKECSGVYGVNTIDASVGEKVKAVFSSGETADLKLQGIYKHGFEQVEHQILINQETAQAIFLDYDKNKADAIYIRLINREITQQMLFEISSLGIKAEIVDWNEKVAIYSREIIKSFGIVGNLSFLIGIIVSSLSVYIILYINILHKRVQIGIIRAIGVDSRIISLSYILQALFYGIFGAVIGILLTFLMVGYFNINPINTALGKIVPQITLINYVLVSLTIIAASTITGYIVSRRIIKQNILNSILNLE